LEKGAFVKIDYMTMFPAGSVRIHNPILLVHEGADLHTELLDWIVVGINNLILNRNKVLFVEKTEESSFLSGIDLIADNRSLNS
jgi:hypothetical protein